MQFHVPLYWFRLTYSIYGFCLYLSLSLSVLISIFIFASFRIDVLIKLFQCVANAKGKNKIAHSGVPDPVKCCRYYWMLFAWKPIFGLPIFHLVSFFLQCWFEGENVNFRAISRRFWRQHIINCLETKVHRTQIISMKSKCYRHSLVFIISFYSYFIAMRIPFDLWQKPKKKIQFSCVCSSNASLCIYAASSATFFLTSSLIQVN